jgi:heat shock protein HslJ
VSADPEAEFRARLGWTWELARLGDQDLPATRAGSGALRPGRHPGPGSRPTLRFTAEPAAALSDRPGRLSAGGWSFCNGYGVAYEFGPGDQLRFHQFQSTLVGCDGPDSLETRFFRALHLTQRFELDSTRLSLVAADGTRLTFVPGPDSGRRPRR